MSYFDPDEDQAYMTSAQLKRQLKQALSDLQKAGQHLEPIYPLSKLKLSTSLWGQAWCKHLVQISKKCTRPGVNTWCKFHL